MANKKVTENEQTSSQSPAKSPEPTRRRTARPKSPARRKSPSRKTPERNVEKRSSPSRVKRTKSSERKDPNKSSKIDKQTTKSSNLTKKDRSNSPQKKIDIGSVSSDEETFIRKEKPKAAVRGRTRKIDTFLEDLQQQKLIQETVSFGEIRRITRQSTLTQEPERVFHLKSFDSPKIKFGEFSDDDLIEDTAKPSDYKLSFSIFFKDLIAFIATPLLIYAVYCVCFKSYCLLDYRIDLKKTNTYYHAKSVVGYASFATFLLILSCVPFLGKRVGSPSKQPKFVYFINGLFSTIFFVTAEVAAEIYGFPVFNFVNERIAFFILPAFLFSLISSLFLFVRSYYSDPCFDTVGIWLLNFHSFVKGREENPRVFNVLDVKLYLVKLWSISIILLDIAILAKGLGLKTSWGSLETNLQPEVLTRHPALLVLAICQLIYAFDAMLFEERMLTTYFFQDEGLGYYNVAGCAVTPLLFAAQLKYVVDYKVQIPASQLSFVLVLFLFGYLIFRIGNNQKDTFRRNPYSPAASSYESIQTAQGKKLLVSGLWGVVRRPNVLGDLLIQVAFLSFTYSTPLSLFYGAIVINLFGRASTGEKRCVAKYKSSWEKYCHRVKYVLVPKVY